AEGGARGPVSLLERESPEPTPERRLQCWPVHRVQPAERLGRLLAEPPAIVRPPAGPRDVDLGQVHRRVALDDPLPDGLPRSGAVDDPLRVEPGRDPEAGHLRELAEVEVRVRREALRRAEVVREAEVVQYGEAFAGVREDGSEMIPVVPELDEAAGGDV